MTYSRRNFLGVAAAGIFGAHRLGIGAVPEARVGTQLYGWGQYYEREGKSLGTHLGEALSAIRDMGYEYAEGSLDTGRPEANWEFAEQLKKHGLKPVCIYTGGRLHTEPEQAIERIVRAAVVCKRAGYSVINCNPDPIGRLKSDEELKTQAVALQRLGEELNKLGLKLGIHHHTPELASNGREYHHNFQKTEAEKVGFCYDVHWVYRGGVKPEDALKQYGDRVVSWHLRQSRDSIWWEDLAAGDVDYGWIAKVAKERGLAPIYSVELALEQGTKVTRSVVENHRRSREFMKQVFGV